jgi:hypothetical protein
MALGSASVIDDSLVDGHKIITADLDGDCSDEVIAGYHGPGRRVYVSYTRAGAWMRSRIGSATANLKWYENLGVR